jgi:[acyl-carrier-protein] S-malonyltransferase
MTDRVFMFPGQSSADPQMLHRAIALHPAAAAMADRARRVLGTAAASRYLDGDRAPLETNRDVQIGVFLATQMHLAALRACGVDAQTSLGLSLGEYSHLVHIGALTFEDALLLVATRGSLYDQCAGGVMVTVLGAVEEVVAQVVACASARGPVVISNFNTPTQHVISGEPGAVAWATERLEDEHGAQTIVIERRVPMHSPLMGTVAHCFRLSLEAAPWAPSERCYWPNVVGCPIYAPRPEDFVTHLAAHVTQPVLWRRAIERLALTNPDATFVEVGPGEVLHNMLGRRWLAVRRARTDHRPADGPAPLSSTAEALRAGR